MRGTRGVVNVLCLTSRWRWLRVLEVQRKRHAGETGQARRRRSNPPETLRQKDRSVSEIWRVVASHAGPLTEGAKPGRVGVTVWVKSLRFSDRGAGPFSLGPVLSMSGAIDE